MGSKISCIKNDSVQLQHFDVYPFDDTIEEHVFKISKCCDDSRCGDLFWPGGYGMCRTELDLKQKNTEKVYRNINSQ